MNPVERSKIRELLLAGHVTIAEVATYCRLSRQAIRKWVSPSAAAEARAALVTTLLDEAVRQPSDKTPKERPSRNARRATVLRALKAGRTTVPEAARDANVSVMAIVAWARLAGIQLPEEYASMRHRRPRSDEPMSAAEIKRSSPA